MPHQEFQIEPGHQLLLQIAGMDSFDAFMRDDATSVSPGGGGERARVRRLKLVNGGQTIVCFLKLTLAHRKLKSVQALVRGKRPHTDAYREMQMVLELAKHGFPAMKVIAWGEERRFGFPLRGFIMVEQAQGTCMQEMFKAGDSELRKKIIAAYAEMLGKLHLKGFFQIVRLKDIICFSENGALSLTLIDRAASNVGRKFFSPWFCLRSIERGFRRMARDKTVFNDDELNDFATVYGKVLASRCKISHSAILAKLK